MIASAAALLLSFGFCVTPPSDSTAQLLQTVRELVQDRPVRVQLHGRVRVGGARIITVAFRGVGDDEERQLAVVRHIPVAPDGTIDAVVHIPARAASVVEGFEFTPVAYDQIEGEAWTAPPGLSAPFFRGGLVIETGKPTRIELY